MRDIGAWLARRGLRAFAFQEDCWAAWRAGQSGLVQVPTGSGKTWAATLAALAEVEAGGGLQLLYLTPLRALSRDVTLAIAAPTEGPDALAPGVRVEARTGDTSSSVRSRQKRRPPEVLVTTPESLCLMLCEEDAALRLASLRTVVVDEWHELCGSKRGTQVELALARLRSYAPGLRCWGLSATLPEAEAAAAALAGADQPTRIVRSDIRREVVLETLLPPQAEVLRQAGHSGLRMVPALLQWLDPERSTLIFTNTRSQAERWFAALGLSMPEWEPILALHHGSLERELREQVEAGLKEGRIKLVVCTSTLDLGVDFGPVDRVVQVGSPKGIARLLQRAGRSGHRPGARAEVLCVPTHMLEIVEFAATREAIARGQLEPRMPLSGPLDVLVQHMVTCAMGGGFDPTELYAELKSTRAYQNLSPDEFDLVLRLVRDGGVLHAYPDYQRIVWREERYRVSSPRIAGLHRTGIGTILGDSAIRVRLVGGPDLGTVEEGFLGRLRPGDEFLFAGRRLELVRLKDDVAQVRLSKKRGGPSAVWGGSRFPISISLADALRRCLERGAQGHRDSPELQAADRFFEVQARISHVPAVHELLAERCETAEGFHLFLFPFEGRLVHEGLAALLALRLGRLRPSTFQLAVSDYGIELLCSESWRWEEHLNAALFSPHNLAADILETANLSALARRQFREVARVAGLLHTGPPGAQKRARHIQANAGLLYDVLDRYDPDNLLLQQARREVLERHFEEGRLQKTLERLQASTIVLKNTKEPGPLALPVIVERLLSAQTLSTESLEARIARIQASWEASGANPPEPRSLPEADPPPLPTVREPPLPPGRRGAGSRPSPRERGQRSRPPRSRRAGWLPAGAPAAAVAPAAALPGDDD